jgi:hypothetical protein
MMRALRLASFSLFLVTAASAQAPPANLYEREVQDLNRSMQQRQREVQQEQQRQFDANQRANQPRFGRMPGEPRPGCPVGSAGC